jgi:hypothetical protein
MGLRTGSSSEPSQFLDVEGVNFHGVPLLWQRGTAKIKEQNERIIDLMTLLREASMGDKDSNDAICQTDIEGKIIAYTNVEGIAAAAIELKIFNSALNVGSKSKDDDKKKMKKQKTRKFNNR